MATRVHISSSVCDTFRQQEICRLKSRKEIAGVLRADK